MLFIEILLLYTLFTISTLLIIYITRIEKEYVVEYIDNYSILLKILSRWINYYLVFRKLIRIHREDYINTFIYVFIIIILCYLMVIAKYGL